VVLACVSVAELSALTSSADDGKNATLFDYAVRPGDTLQLFRKALPQEEHHDAGDGGAGPNEGEAPVSAEPAKEEVCVFRNSGLRAARKMILSFWQSAQHF
jgi:hypothetical protein